MRYIVLLFGSLLTILSGCKESADILMFDNKDAYIYFGYPNPDTRAVEKFTDSLFYSFALDNEVGLSEKTLAIPVNIGGKSTTEDRAYSFKISETSNYDKSLVEISEPVIRKGLYVDTLFVKIKRGAELSTKEMSLVLELSANENFDLGNRFNRKIKIAFADILVKPTWWTTWQLYFGDYQKEKYQKWIEIYHFGADPSNEYYNNIPGPYYYWKQMPTFVSTNIFGITIMYIEQLKKYFEKNVVYPNGDTTAPRVLLP